MWTCPPGPIGWDLRPSGFSVNQLIVLRGLFNEHPNLIRFLDYNEVLKSYRTLMTCTLTVILQLFHGKTEDL